MSFVETSERRGRHAVVAAGLLAAVVTVGYAEEESPAASELEALFRANAHELVLFEGKLTGPGADFLLAATDDVPFVCIGEPHNVNDIPRFVSALFGQLQDLHGFHYLAIEQGPFITRFLATEALAKGRDEIRKLAKKRRKALHFRTVEEVDMIADVARASNGSIVGVWGLDRVLDPSALQDYLESPAGRDDPEAAFLRDRAAWSTDNLSRYSAPRGSPESDSADSHREDGFKTGFRYEYDRATGGDGSPARVVFRFGHVHMGRLEGKRYASLGHFVSRFAADEGLDSFHLNLQLINRPGKYWSLTEYPEYEPLAEVGDPDRWIIVDLRPARQALSAGAARPHDKLVKLIFDFDAVLFLGGASKGKKL